MLVILALGCASNLSGHVREPPADSDAVVDTADSDAPDSDVPEDTDDDTGNGANPRGVDVSHWDGDIDWDAVRADDIQFVYAKATQGTGFRDPMFSEMFEGAGEAGLYRGAYHFAEPDSSDGATQADFFVDNGGDWLDDGITMPGAVDIEWNPDGPDCYGLSRSEMVDWIHGFVDRYEARTGRLPTIYCGKTWWTECVGSSDFAADPLWVASWDVDEPNLPQGWSSELIWQYGATEVDGIDVDADINVFNGSSAKLRAFADDRL